MDLLYGNLSVFFCYLQQDLLPGKTCYSSLWEKEFRWLTNVQYDKYSAMCTMCQKVFKIDGSGISQVRSHGASQKHKDVATKQSSNQEKAKKQTKILIVDEQFSVKQQKISFAFEEQVLKAEVIQALKTVDSGHSFASCETNGAQFREMFPDSTIAASYSQSSTKVKYVIQYGLAPHFADQLKKDLLNVPFTYLFDETTNSQVKKQYDVYVQYWSKRENHIVISYVGSLMIGHCTADDLVSHFNLFMKNKLGLNPAFLLHIGMDGPNVNKSFQRKLSKQLEDESNTSFLDYGSCSLHIVHNAFRKGIAALSFNIEQLILDLHYFFKLSSARRMDYKSVEALTEVTAWYMLRYTSSRWLSLKPAALRILEQWPNILEYFLKFLPSLNIFAKEIRDTGRYKRIASMLENEMTPAYLAFVVFVAQDFESFLLKFQKKEPQIHNLYGGMGSLLSSLFQKFVRKEKMTNEDGKPMPVTELAKMDVSKTEIHLKNKKIDIGTHTLRILTEKNLSKEPMKKFRNECVGFFVASVTMLQSKLPFQSKILQHAQAINPKTRHQPETLTSISKLSLEMMEPLKKVSSMK